jgi:hypothetical protein
VNTPTSEINPSTNRDFLVVNAGITYEARIRIIPGSSPTILFVGTETRESKNQIDTYIIIKMIVLCT